MDSRGFSPDGYITDQDFFEDVIYRGIPASDNGCGWIAAYNIRRALGQAPSFEQVLREMDAMHVLRVPGPTTMNVMRAYLRKYVPDMRESCGREAALAAAVRSRMGILRYSEAGIPHFISFLRVEEGFRFFNVNDGLEDYVCSMEAFFAGHVGRSQYVSVFTLEQPGV